MNVTVEKTPDGVLYMTKDGHGEIFSDDVDLDEIHSFGDNTLELTADVHPFAEEGAVLVRFSYVDYLDTSNREVPGVGVRHTWEKTVPGRFSFGPYVVEVSDG